MFRTTIVMFGFLFFFFSDLTFKINVPYAFKNDPLIVSLMGTIQRKKTDIGKKSLLETMKLTFRFYIFKFKLISEKMETIPV